MALLRSATRLGVLSRQCTRLASAQQQSRRNYAEMAFTFASTDKVFYSHADVKQVDVPSFSGSFGILPEHVPLLAVLKPGVLSVTEKEGSVSQFFVSSGSITINDDSSVQILAEEAARLEDLDRDAIRDGMNKAQQEVGGASSEQARAEAQIAVECYEALEKALSK